MSSPRSSVPPAEKLRALSHVRPVGIREELDEWKRTGPFRLWMRNAIAGTPGMTVSLIVHAVVLVLLALITIIPEIDHVIPSLIATSDEDRKDIVPDDAPEIDTHDPVDDPSLVVNVVSDPSVTEPTADPSPSPEPAANFGAIELDQGLEKIRFNPLGKVGRANGTDGIIGCRGPDKARLMAERGGTPDCEAAVGRALKWLAAHQMPSGAWSFNHGLDNGHVGPVNDPGSETSKTAATALGLLPFLGAGQTHEEGKYKDVVKRGLYALMREGKRTPQGFDLRGGGSMYAHGLASIALCEAYAMTHNKSRDSELGAAAQGSLDFIVSAQDMTGGGWRYTPGQPGDTSVVGWQLMALKSGHMAYLKVPARTIAGVVHFLDHVESDRGAQYGYTTAGSGPATTAVGLLCRMYLGWKKEQPGLEGGVKYLSAQGPSRNNVYFNYYAAQVLMHWEGEEWRKWNRVMRDQLLATQVQTGTPSAELGSWYTPGQQHGERGGRLYETSLSAMTLEVYYRHMPIYGKQAADADDFDGK